eukprot:1151852-Prymnesium_polylepis.1
MSASGWGTHFEWACGRPQRAPRAPLHARMLTALTVHYKDGVMQCLFAHYGVHTACAISRV